MPTWRRSIGSAVTSSPPKKTRPPASGVSSPAMMRRRVVLPQPDGPRSTSVSPSATSRSSVLSPRVPSGNVLATERRRIISALTPLTDSLFCEPLQSDEQRHDHEEEDHGV